MDLQGQQKVKLVPGVVGTTVRCKCRDLSKSVKLLMSIRLQRVTEPSQQSMNSSIHSQADGGQVVGTPDSRYAPLEWSTNQDHAESQA